MHSIKYIVIITAMLLFIFSACIRSNADNLSSPAIVWQTINAVEAHRMMNQLSSFILLDVRNAEEYLQNRINGAVLIPVSEIRQRAEIELPDKNAVILIYCQGGIRSARAAAVLAELGYINVYDFGGIANWPYETVRN